MRAFGRGARNPMRYGGIRGREFRAMTLELKSIDTLQITWSNQIGVGSVPTLLNIIALGTDFNARLGRMVIVKSIQISGWIEPYDSVLYDMPEGQRIRMIVFVDRQPNGSAAGSADLLQGASGAVDTTCPLNLNNRNRFTVIADQFFEIGPLRMTQTAKSQAGFTHLPRVKFYKKVNIPVTYMGTGATIASIASNAIYGLFIGDYPSAAISNLCFRGCTRLRFVDG